MPKDPESSPKRRRLFRIGAVILGFSFLPVVELLCRLLGIGSAPAYEDPFVGFQGVKPLFELSSDRATYSIPKSKLKFFSPESFAAKKPAGAFRVFCLGGSTVKGRPYSKETSFSTWLELSLQAAEPDRGWEVINCGGISYASYRLVHILRETLAYEPDLFVICTGHNEFLEDRSYETLKRLPQAVAITQSWASRLHVYRALRSTLFPNEPSASDRFEMSTEVEALLDYRGGLEVYDRNDDWRTNVVRHFEHNLRAMIEMSGDAGIPVILIRPPSNLRSSPPFKSQHRSDITADQVIEWEHEIKTAHSLYTNDLKQAVRHLQRAIAVDNRHAATHYELGKCHELLGNRSAAHRHFIRALDEDICPLRMIPALITAMQQVAGSSRTPLIDAHALLEKESRLQILGNDQLVDHIHPSIEGHKRLAVAIQNHMESQGWVNPVEGWEQRRDVSFRKHFATLDSAYFAAARRALHGLNEWAAGRAEGVPIESRPSPSKK